MTEAGVGGRRVKAHGECAFHLRGHVLILCGVRRTTSSRECVVTRVCVIETGRCALFVRRDATCLVRACACDCVLWEVMRRLDKYDMENDLTCYTIYIPMDEFTRIAWGRACVVLDALPAPRMQKQKAANQQSFGSSESPDAERRAVHHAAHVFPIREHDVHKALRRDLVACVDPHLDQIAQHRF